MLTLMEKVYFGSLGKNICPCDESRIATEPLAVLGDMADIMRACRERMIEAAANQLGAHDRDTP